MSSNLNRALLRFAVLLTAIALAGCSGGGKAPTVPGVDDSARDTTVEVGGGACDRAFDVECDITVERPGFPSGFEIQTDGEILIHDEDCQAQESGVTVRFSFNGPNPTEQEVPGNKTVSGDETTYSGEQTRNVDESEFHWYEVHDEFELLTYPEERAGVIVGSGGLIIEGWYHQHRTDWWSTGRGDVTEGHTDYHCAISGESVAALEVGPIQGPDTLDEYSFRDYSITASGDTGITYEWAVAPPTGGLFTEPNSPATQFRLAGVDSDSTVEISVSVSSDNAGPVVRTLTISVLDAITTADNLHEVDFLPMHLVDVDGDTYTFDYEGTPPQLSEGDIIVGSDDLGYLRMVGSTIDTGSSLIIETSRATLEDVIIEGTLSASLDFTGGHQGEVYREANGVVDEVLEFEPIRFDFAEFLEDGMLYSDDVVTLQLTEGFLEFRPYLDFYLNYTELPPGLNSLSASAIGELELALAVLATADSEWHIGEYPPDKPLVTHYVPLPPLAFVPLTLQVDFFAGYRVDAYGHVEVETGLDYLCWMELGFEYDRVTCPGWCLINDSGQDWEWTPPEPKAYADLEARVFIKPKLSLVVAGIASAGIDAEPYLRLDATAYYDSPEDWCFDYDIYGGLTSDAEADVTILCWNLYNERWDLLDLEWNLCEPIDDWWPGLGCEPIGPCGQQPPNQPPTAAAHADKYDVDPFEPVQFYDDSTDPDGPDDIVKWEWDFDFDGGFATDSFLQNPIHSYSVLGLHRVQLKVTDTADNADMLNVPLEITVGGGPPPNKPPVAKAHASKYVAEPGETIHFYDDSTDPEGPDDIVKWEWDFYYDGSFHTDSFQQNPSYAYLSEGEYEVQLRVTDSVGHQDLLNDPLVITVSETPPPCPDPPTVEIENCPTWTYTSHTFNWTMSDDCTSPSQLQVEISKDFGDHFPISPGSTSYTWNGIGCGGHIIEVKVTDAHGKSSTDSCSFTKEWYPPYLNILNCPEPDFGECWWYPGTLYNFRWEMDDDCTPPSELRIYYKSDDSGWQYLGEGEDHLWFPLEEGPELHRLTIKAVDDQGYDAQDYCEYYTDREPDAGFTNCPDLVWPLSEYCFEWWMDDDHDADSDLMVYVRTDIDPNWQALGYGVTQTCWAWMPAGDRWIDVWVEDKKCGNSKVIRCEFTCWYW